jgi:hypothetical protein
LSTAGFLSDALVTGVFSHFTHMPQVIVVYGFLLWYNMRTFLLLSVALERVTLIFSRYIPTALDCREMQRGRFEIRVSIEAAHHKG